MENNKNINLLFLLLIFTNVMFIQSYDVSIFLIKYIYNNIERFMGYSYHNINVL